MKPRYKKQRGNIVLPVRTVRIIIPINIIDGHSCYTYTFSDLRITTPKRDEITGRCLSSVHHPVIDQCLPFRKADAKVETIYDTGKYFTNFFEKNQLILLLIWYMYRQEPFSSPLRVVLVDAKNSSRFINSS